jgi:hypothetical protein
MKMHPNILLPRVTHLNGPDLNPNGRILAPKRFVRQSLYQFRLANVAFSHDQELGLPLAASLLLVCSQESQDRAGALGNYMLRGNLNLLGV